MLLQLYSSYGYCDSRWRQSEPGTSVLWASCQVVNITGCACAGNAGTFSPPPRFSDRDMHHGTCVMHVPWCMPGSLTSGFLWSRWRGKRSRHSRYMHNPRFYVSGKRHMDSSIVLYFVRQGSDRNSNATSLMQRIQYGVSQCEIILHAPRVKQFESDTVNSQAKWHDLRPWKWVICGCAVCENWKLHNRKILVPCMALR